MIDQAQVMILNVLVVVTRPGYLMVSNAKFYQTFGGVNIPDAAIAPPNLGILSEILWFSLLT